MNHKHSDETVNAVRHLVGFLGFSYSDAGAAIGLSRNMIAGLCRRHEIKSKNSQPAQIRNGYIAARKVNRTGRTAEGHRAMMAITEAVAIEYKTTVEAIRGPGRGIYIRMARYEAMRRICGLKGYSQGAIAQWFFRPSSMMADALRMAEKNPFKLPIT